MDLLAPGRSAGHPDERVTPDSPNGFVNDVVASCQEDRGPVVQDEQVPRRSDRVVCRSLADGEAVLLHLDSGEYHGLNDSGLAVWELLDGQRSARLIAQELRDRFDEVPEDVGDLVRTFLTHLDERALLEFRDRP